MSEFPPDEFRIHARVEGVSETFNSDWVELKIKILNCPEIDEGNCQWRIWASRGRKYRIGQEMCWKVTLLEEGS